MLWSLPLCLYHPAVQALLPFSLFIPTVFSFPFASFCGTPFSCFSHLFHSFWWLLICSFLPSFLPSLNLPFSSPPFSVQSVLSSSLSQICLDTDSSFYPFRSLNPLLFFPLCALFLIASLSIILVSFVLHLSFFLHVSWYCRCVPNVPQTLFSTIKLLSLPSPAAARITWAEQALLNIEQHREEGTQG